MNNELVFVIFCIENYKVCRGLTGKQTLKLFIDSGVFDYLVENYSVLHTTGTHYVIKDIDEFLKIRGIKI